MSAIKKSQIPNHKYQMVRQAVRQAHGPERRRRTHHPEPGRRANHNDQNLKFQTIDGFVKRRIFPFIWIPAFAGMTMKILISGRYNSRHTREGGYPGAKVTVYDFIKQLGFRSCLRFGYCNLEFIWPNFKIRWCLLFVISLRAVGSNRAGGRFIRI